jgi:hypothetical protein
MLEQTMRSVQGQERRRAGRRVGPTVGAVSIQRKRLTFLSFISLERSSKSIAPLYERAVDWGISSMRSLMAALLGCLASVAAFTAGAEECTQVSNPIETDRPDITNSSIVLPVGSFQSENGINLSRRDVPRSLMGLTAGYGWVSRHAWKY